MQSVRRGARVSVLLLLALLMGSARAQEPKRPLRVLFIGNSLTFTNDLPAIVQALADSAHERHLTYHTVAFSGYNLKDHWRHRAAQRAIARGHWDVVVLQQGPSAQAESRAALLAYARRYAALIRRIGAKPAIYMVWPALSRARDFDRVSESYRMAAEAVGGMLLPAGEAWRAAWRRDADLPLYGPDTFHPSATGSYLAALVIFARLYERSPVGLAARLSPQGEASPIRLPPEKAALLQAAAAEAITRF